MPPVTLQRLRSASRYLVVVAAAVVLIGWWVNTPAGLLSKADAIGYAVCHQISSRSFHIGNIQLPLCARCTGMYLGAMTGLIYQMVIGGRRTRIPPWRVLIPLIVFALGFGLDGANSYLYLVKEVNPGFLAKIPNLYTPTNTLRLLTGSGMGLGLAAVLLPAFNQTAWAQDDHRSALPTLKAFGVLVLIQLVLDLLVLTQSPIVLYPVAVISVLGVLVLLTMVYSMVWIMIMGEENKFQRLPQLWMPLLAGFTVAMIQTAAVDAVRFWLTGTWSGFPISG